jgi:DNA recombination protein RmuC
VLEALQDLGKSLDKSRGSYELAMDRLARGKGNMVKRVGDLAKLGAKTKKALPQDLVDRSDDAADWLQSSDSDPELLASVNETSENADGD